MNNYTNPIVNQSVNIIEEQIRARDHQFTTLVQRLLTICFSLLILILNSALCFTVYYFKKLRNRTELIILSGLAFTDILCGVAYITQSIRSLVVTFCCNSPPEVGAVFMTPLDCMHEFSVNIYIIGTELLPIMLMVVSIDRLVSVCSLKLYESLDKGYRLCMLGAPVGYVLCSYAFAWYGTLKMSPVPNSDNSCVIAQAVTKTFYAYHNTLQLTAECCSVLIYGAVLAMLQRRFRNSTGSISELGPRSGSGPGSKLAAVERRQVKMTKTLGFMCFATVLFLIVPQALILYFGYFYKGPTIISEMGLIGCRIITAAYSCINVTVCLARSRDLRCYMRLWFYSILPRCCRGKRPKEINPDPDLDPDPGLNPVSVIGHKQHQNQSMTCGEKTSFSGGRSSVVGREPVIPVFEVGGEFIGAAKELKYIRAPKQKKIDAKINNNSLKINNNLKNNNNIKINAKNKSSVLKVECAAEASGRSSPLSRRSTPASVISIRHE